MRIKSSTAIRASLLISLTMSLTLSSTRLHADTGTCGGATITLPFTDVPSGNVFFCSIAEAFFSGLSNGTTSTTYSPSASVPREQMAAFVTRTLDQSLKRGSRRAALRQFWTPGTGDDLALTPLGGSPALVESDGVDIWVANGGANTVVRVRAGDGKVLDTWTGATNSSGVVSAKGRIFVAGQTTPGSLYQIDPTQPAGAVTTLTTSLGGNSTGISFDGSRIWTANTGGSVSIITLNPLSVSTVTLGFTVPGGILYDGANTWVTDAGADKLFKLDSSGAIIQTVNVGSQPAIPAFDGTNIWVPNQLANTVTVVRAATGTVLATLSGNGLGVPEVASFDGERMLITNISGNSVSLWKASDLSPLGFVGTGMDSNPIGACSDGLNFWIALSGTGKLARF